MKKWTGAFQIAAVYVGTVIGAGFATGREIVEFFSRFGFFGLIAILFSGYLFIFLGSKMMLAAIHIRATSYEELNEYLFGKTIAKVMNVIMMVMLLGVCAVMLSGAESLFHEQLGFAKKTGSMLTIILAAIVMAKGIKGLFAVNTFVVPLLIFFNLFLLADIYLKGNSIEHLFDMPTISVGWKALLSALSYSAFNLALAQAVLVPIAANINDREIVKYGGMIGGGLLTLILLSSHLILITLPDVAAFDIPMAVIVKQATSSIYFVYVCIIYGEIFTSIVGNMYGLERQINRYLHVNKLIINGGILAIIFFAGRINYGTLLGYLYPLFGYVSLGFLLLLILKKLENSEL